MRSITDFRSWELFSEKPLDLKFKAKLENIGIKVSPWTIVANGTNGVVYDLTREMFGARKEEIVERLERGPLGPCGESSLTPRVLPETGRAA